MLPLIAVKASTNNVSDGFRAFDAGWYFMCSFPGSLQEDPCEKWDLGHWPGKSIAYIFKAFL